MQYGRVLLVVALLIVATTVPVVGAGASPSAAADPAPSVAQSIDATCEYPLERTDARGETISLEAEPDEVVTLYPGDAQLAFQIGAEDRVVGMPVGQYTDGLEAGDRTDISADDGVTPVAEEIVALDPDVVLAANVALTDEDFIEQLEDAGIAVYVLDTATSVDDVRENVEVAGELTGTCDGAEETVAWMDDRLAVIEDALEDVDEPLAYYVSDDEGTTPGTETFQHDVLTSAGLENVAERAGIDDWQTISAEVVVEEDPDWIVYPDWIDEPPVEEGIEATTAMEDGNVVSVDDNAMSQPAPEIVHVVTALLETVHPDVYADLEADLDSIDERYDVDTEVGTEDVISDVGYETDDEPSADDGSDSSDDAQDATDEAEALDGEDDDEGAFPVPGFGIVATVIVLCSILAVYGLRSE
ncbi:ABC transporter substrate-binding protein [Natrarchaeobius halalkaliphilus]|uniref:ABC transporter substrate-binding protein n=1 Tax=Natrarchaeobius halalkaliphilus TaxID=1679091 RepID=A0A3N6P3D7_9EURY|nr:PGF-CTERM-anchored ABC transporter substrate-binding protein [Natrarchaeobius halalkaliphilus]RQG89785.1 ABC transporter substrate-binding protein [Natrarchaeobius halalkaliphilus]